MPCSAQSTGEMVGLTGLTAFILTVGLSRLVGAGSDKNRTSVTDPLQRVMLEFNLYQVDTTS